MRRIPLAAALLFAAAAPPAAASPAASPAAPPAAAAGEHYSYSIARGTGEGWGAASYFIAPDGRLVGHFALATGTGIMREVATPKAPSGDTLAGSYSTVWSDAVGDHQGALAIRVALRDAERKITYYWLDWDGGAAHGFGFRIDGHALHAAIGSTIAGYMARTENGGPWRLVLLDAGGAELKTEVLTFPDGAIAGKHDFAIGTKALGTLNTIVGADGELYFALPAGERILGVCEMIAESGCDAPH